MADLQRFIDRMRYWCDVADLGYDQSNRWDFRDGGESDCSSLVVHALQEAGFDTGGATYTGNMSAELCARGWQRVRNDGNPQPGDILLNDRDHVAVWLGDCLAQASIDENGNISGGRGGDQTGRETHTRSYYDFPWDCYLRWTGAPAQGGSQGPASPAPSKGEWQGDMVGLRDTTGSGDDYAGVLGRPILDIAIDGVGMYQASDIDHGWWDEVRKYDLSDPEEGYAGNDRPIDKLRIFDSSVKYQLHILGRPADSGWHDVMEGVTDTGGSGDDFAGERGVQHDLVRIWRDSGEQPRYNVFS